MRYRGLKITGFLIVQLITICTLTACVDRSGTRVIIAGSTSVQPYVEVLAEEYAELFPQIEVDVQGGGSSAGVAAAISGTADIGMSSRALTEKEQGLWSWEIARDGLAVIIHLKNPVQNLTLEQIRDIYAAKITNWNQLELEEPSAGGLTARIHIITREEGSGTRSAFESLVMKDVEITPRAIVQDSNGAVRQLVSDDIHSIGFISLGLVDHTVKALSLNGMAPTRGNVIDGYYNLYRPFLFVTDSEPEGHIKQFIDFTLSEEGQKILEHEGLIRGTGTGLSINIKDGQ